MNKNDRKIITDSLQTYLRTGVEIDRLDLESWVDILKKTACKKDMAVLAFKLLKDKFPPVDHYGKLPSVKEFKQIYNELAAPKFTKREKCPCCDNTGYVLFKHHDGQELVHDCTCYLRTGQRARTTSFEEIFHFNLCDNLNCMNSDKESRSVVVKHSGPFFKHLKKCKFVQTLTEE